MSYVKYREDDIKISNDRLFMCRGSQFSKIKEPKRYYECKYCHQIFTSKSELISHIRDIHNIVRPLLVINDKVVGDQVVLQYIHHAKILMYGFDGEIRVGGDLVRYSDDDEIDITAILKSKLSSSARCKISVNKVPIRIVYHPLSLDDNSHIKQVIDEWQYAASSGHSLDTKHLALFDGADLLFLQGIYNYYLACTAKHHKASRYDDAFAALSQIQDLGGLGRCVLKAIAFRRNWIDTLRLLAEGEDDIFSTACEFFSEEKSLFTYEKDKCAGYLFIEDSTQMSLELISLYQKGRYGEVKAKLAAIGDPDDFDDPNLIEQLYLLKARIAITDGDNTQATRYYEKLIAPAFREEYRKHQRR